MSDAADYLVIGAGATGLAFTDSLVCESDVEVVLVDRRDGVGGHWRDSYPIRTPAYRVDVLRRQLAAARQGSHHPGRPQRRLLRAGVGGGGHRVLRAGTQREAARDRPRSTAGTARTSQPRRGTGAGPRLCDQRSPNHPSTPPSGRRPLSGGLDPRHARAHLRDRPRRSVRPCRCAAVGSAGLCPIHRHRRRQDGR